MTTESDALIRLLAEIAAGLVAVRAEERRHVKVLDLAIGKIRAIEAFSGAMELGRQIAEVAMPPLCDRVLSAGHDWRAELRGPA